MLHTSVDGIAAEAGGLRAGDIAALATGSDDAAFFQAAHGRRSSRPPRQKSADLDVLSDIGSSSSGGTEVPEGSLLRGFSLGKLEGIPTFVGGDGDDWREQVEAPSKGHSRSKHSINPLEAEALASQREGGNPSPESAVTSRISCSSAGTPDFSNHQLQQFHQHQHDQQPQPQQQQQQQQQQQPWIEDQGARESGWELVSGVG